jgi:hypothetical protein
VTIIVDGTPDGPGLRDDALTTAEDSRERPEVGDVQTITGQSRSASATVIAD